MARSFNPMNPFDFFDLGLQQYKLALASGETIIRRSSLYSSGTLSMTEAVSMWLEKPTAMVKGFEGAAIALAGGKPPAAIARAALAPMTAKASSNAKRLRAPRVRTA